MTGSILRWLAAASCALAIASNTACVTSQAVVCQDGTVCPALNVCTPYGCVLPLQITSCIDPPADGSCTLPNEDTGACIDGVCLAIGCGNGVLEVNEACDDANAVGGDGCSARCDSDETCGNAYLDAAMSEACDCGDAAFVGERPRSCNGKPNSNDPDTVCTSSCKIRGCGDGMVGGLEQCDGADLPLTSCSDVGFYAGNLACLDSCRYDVSGCSGRCGDAIRNGPSGGPIELCDGGDLDGRDCTTYGYSNAAGLACNDLCTLDVTACTGYCGDGTFDAGNEICDPGESAAVLAARGLDCTDFGFHVASGLTCANTCQFDTSGCGGGYCGDGTRQASEECDGVDLAGTSCTAFGYYQPGGLSCRDNCRFDRSACVQRCGDLTVNGPEQCDGSVPAGTDCTTFGYYTAAGLACSATCAFDTGACSQRCGDSTINGVEQCDGSVPSGSDCTDFGYYTPTGLTCSSGCTMDPTTCTGGICGDSTVNVPEEDCEPALGVGAYDCTDFGFYASSGLACNSACGFDTTACRRRCGDDLVNGPEICDGAPPAGLACAYAGWDAGQLGCAAGCYDTFEHCRRIGFASEYPGFTTDSLHDVWGTGREFFAVGAADALTKITRIIHSTGGAWSQMTNPATATLLGVWGSSPADVFAVGLPTDAGTSYGVYRYNGTSWSLMTAPASPTQLNDVHGTSATNVWAVGNAAHVLLYDGSWTKLTTPIAATVALNGVWASSASTVFVVGSSGAIWRWNGISWDDLSVATTNAFLGIWGVSATEIYAITASEVWRYDGATWTTMTTTCSVNQRAVGGMPSGPVVITGLQGRVCQLAGGRWHVVSMPSSSAGLFGASGSTEGLYVVGSGPTVLGSSGASWLTVTSPSSIPAFAALWGTAADNLYAVGEATGPVELIHRFNGTAWTAQTTPGGAFRLLEITGGASWAVAVGSGGRILSSDGSGGVWSAPSSITTNQLHGVWGDPTGTIVYAVGVAGTIVRRSSGIWSVDSSTVTSDLRAVWGTGTTIFAAGAAGTIVRTENAGPWTVMPSPTNQDLFDLWGRSASDVFAVGTGGLFHFNGISWTAIASAPSLTKVWGAAGDVFVSAGSSLYQLVGGRVLPVVKPIASFSPVDIHGTGDITWFLRSGTTTNLLALGGRLFRPAASETVCDDFWDDDEDGLPDCADPQCAGNAACTNGGGCQPVIDVACNATVAGTTVGGATRWPSYGAGCATTRDQTGPEAFYRVRRATAGSISLTLSGYSGTDLDLIVSSTSTTGACLPEESCLSASQTTSKAAGATEATTFAAAPATDYIVIVDGHEGASSGFDLQVACP